MFDLQFLPAGFVERLVVGDLTTTLVMSLPNRSANSCSVVSVSSTVSCSTAAHKAVRFVTQSSLARTLASAMGWLMYGEAAMSLRH